MLHQIVKDKEGEEIFEVLSHMSSEDAKEHYDTVLTDAQREHYVKFLTWRDNVEIVKTVAPWFALGGVVIIIGYAVRNRMSEDDAEEAESETPNEEFDN